MAADFVAELFYCVILKGDFGFKFADALLELVVDLLLRVFRCVFGLLVGVIHLGLYSLFSFSISTAKCRCYREILMFSG